MTKHPVIARLKAVAIHGREVIRLNYRIGNN